jgi:hypothetical protein
LFVTPISPGSLDVGKSRLLVGVIPLLRGFRKSRPCLFHDDRSPSLHVYLEPGRGWYCFGCGRGGSIYDLAALLSGRETRGSDFSEVRRELRELIVAAQASFEYGR